MGSSPCQRLLNGQGQQIQLLGLLAGHEQVLIERFADLGKYTGNTVDGREILLQLIDGVSHYL